MPPSLIATTLRMAAPVLLLAGAALLAPGAAAQADPQAAERDARHWLSRLHEAAGKRNFQGTFVVSTGGSMASARIVHFCEGDSQFERIEPLDGQKRQIYRHDDVVHSFWPHSRQAVVETRLAMRGFPALLSSGADRILEHYEAHNLGDGRVAGHEARVLLLKPRDRYRHGQRLWAEKQSGLLLRAEVFDERDVVLEAAAFSDLMIGVKPRPELVKQAMKRLEGFEVHRPRLDQVDLDREGWAFSNLPPGFRLVSSVRRAMQPAQGGAADAPPKVLQAIYSDGLTHVSVFIEPFDAAAQRREVQVALGAMQTLARRQGDWWLTVVGDVPVVTLRAFAAGLERRR